MWFGSQKSAGTVPTQRGSTAAPRRPSLEIPTSVAARGLSPVNAVIEHLTASQCRLRTVVLLDRNEVLAFDVNLPGQKPMTARGRVLSCTSAPPRFIYTISLDVMAERHVDELARGLAASYPQHRSRLLDVASLRDLPTTDGLTRTKPRQATEFAVQYRTPNGRIKAATATEISTGGIRLICSDALVESELVELRFTLPSTVLDAYHEETAVLDLRGAGQRRNVVPSRLREPFQELVAYARVRYHKPLGMQTYEFGLEFCALDRAAHDEIARYVDAARLFVTRCRRAD
jgi:hypothetical protein